MLENQEIFETLNIIADESAEKMRIEKWLADSGNTGLTRSRIDNLVRSGYIKVNGISIIRTVKLKSGDRIEINIPPPLDLEIKPENIPLDIIYEDNDLLVVNKSKGMVVHPAHGNYTGTLVNALLYHCKDSLSGINGIIRPGIVHRIDKNTSGLLIIAKNDVSHLKLSEQIKAHSFTREYEAVASGYFKESSGTIDAPIGRHHTERKKMCVTYENSRNAVTHYEVIKQYGGYAYLKLKLETGRTHQIRVHLSYINHPILGDDVYGKSYKNIEGQCLHARKIGFVHPSTGEYMEFTSELPEYFLKILRIIEKQ